MVTLHLLSADEVHRGIILIKIVGHGLDLFLDSGKIRALLGHHKALSGVFFSGGQLRILSRAHFSKRIFHRNGVLSGIRNAFDSSDSIGMSLADALAPEGVILTAGKDRVGIQAVQGKHAGIPAAGNDPHLTALLRCFIHRREMLRDLRMGIKAVDYIEILNKFRGLHRKIRSASSAENHHIDFILHPRRFFHTADLYALRQNGNCPRITSGEHCCKFHVRILLNGAFHALSQVSIAQDTNSDLFAHSEFPPFWHKLCSCRPHYSSPRRRLYPVSFFVLQYITKPAGIQSPFPAAAAL